ncbi:MAG: flagellar filament protein FlaA [Spirochaetales bacterium]|nr:flagellar filament protein FlaA [Spirochaetales bacterium]
MKKKIILSACIVLLLPMALAAQSTGAVDPERLGKDQAQQYLGEVSISKFEDVAFWGAAMPLDEGVIQIRRFEGAPAAKKPMEGEEQAGIEEQDKFVLGAKLQFFRRGGGSAAIFPVRPIPVEGITKTISVWVVGRNYNHVLKAVVADYFNQRREVTLGKLNFMGWKQLTAAVPPRIVQDEYHFAADRGLKLVGFKIEFDLPERYGTYYIYLDDARAVSDLFAEAYRDADDMADGW